MSRDAADRKRQDGVTGHVTGKLTRRGLLGLTGAWLGSTSVLAQQPSWLDTIPGFSTPGSRPASDKRAPKSTTPEVLNDLRQDPTPIRGEETYEALERAIGHYQDIASRGGWPIIPGTRMMRPGDDDERVMILRRRLQITGDLPGPAGNSAAYAFDGHLEEAVRRFQERHGLRVSGRADGPTIAALNVPAAARVAQLRLNLQRVRELLAQRIEDRYVLVNVPAFQLEAVEQHMVHLRHRVIVGRPDRQSPVVRATIKGVNFFPYWRVPDSVATLDLIPRLMREPDYLAKEYIRVLSGNFNGPELDPSQIDWRTADPVRIKFRQDPGPQNALGLVRIDMPNEHGVYMHDTPMKKLFESRGRAFSAGCVRVQDVFQLVAWIARDEPGFDKSKIDEVLAAGIGYDIPLTRPIPVYFTYITAWAERSGRVEFRPDVYGRDGQHELVAGRDRDPSEPAPPPQSLAP
ncbi:MAG TPA: L,D-transpeptidase family protein [Hyphomicrobiaceae bacterium]|nr:L,D-transpeptidase family protein [Hyphomicrobiaceae bacterium]